MASNLSKIYWTISSFGRQVDEWRKQQDIEIQHKVTEAQRDKERKFLINLRVFAFKTSL